MQIEILYEDDNILAINKPAGLVVHPDGKTAEPSVSEWFVEKYPEAKEVGEPIQLTPSTKNLAPSIERPGIVHRIDRETSGVLLLAKTLSGYRTLKEQFQNREIEKKYHAFLYGNLKEDHGSVNMPIVRSKSDFRKRVAIASSRIEGRGESREALTYFKVLKRVPEATFVEAKPKTGRTHQIRVHFKALHHPVVCDSLYAQGKPNLLGFKRLALHAKEVTFMDASGHKHTIDAPYPADFEQAIEQISWVC